MQNPFFTIIKPKDFSIKANLVDNRYITNGHIWTIDETIFNDETRLCFVVHLKTRAILGYMQGKECVTEDSVIKLYEKILDSYQLKPPVIIHSDMDQAYHSKKVLKFLKENNIQPSVTNGVKNQNQVSESLNNRIKHLVTELLIKDKNSRSFRRFHKTLPLTLKNIPDDETKCKNREYRKHLFQSNHFKNHRKDIIRKAMDKYNEGDFRDGGGISRELAQYFDSFIEPPTIENTKLVDAKHMLTSQIRQENINSIKQVQSSVLDILEKDIDSEEKITEIVSLFFKRQENTDDLLIRGFVGISKQLAEEKAELKEELEQQTLQLEQQTLQNKHLTKMFEDMLEQQALIEERKIKRKNRKRLPKREAMSEDIYQFLIDKANKKYRETYNGARLRLAITLLAITGVRISELLPLKVHQIENLFTHSWIAIDRLKRGPANHKAFLTPKGAKLIKQRARDFEIITYLKQDDSFVFTPQNADRPLHRQAFNRIINSFIKEATQQLDNKPNIKSYSFRIGFITELWRDVGDIEFVRQVIGHVKVDTTSKYVQNLTEEERKNRMINLKTQDDLFYKS